MDDNIEKVKTGRFVTRDENSSILDGYKKQRFKIHKFRIPIKKSKSISKKTAVTTAACAVVVFALLSVFAIDSDFTNSISKEIKTALSFDINIDETLGKLKFVQGNDTNVKDVIAPSVKPFLKMPTTAQMIAGFDDTKEGMIFETDKISDVFAPGNGVIESVEIDNGFTVTIDHQNGIKSAIKFNGAIGVLKEGQKVKYGDSLGILEKNKQLTFYVIQNGRNIDPKLYSIN